MKFHFVYLICFLFAWNSISSQKKVHIYGYVVDENDKGVEFASVFQKDPLIGTVTQKHGYYELNIEVQDTAIITYSMLGYKTIEHKVSNLSSVVQINVQLAANTTEIGKVEVLGQRRNTSSMEFVDPSKFKFTPNTSGNIESLLVTFAGVSQNNELSSQYNVRGGSFDENMVYVNGIEIYRPLLIRAGQQEGLSFVNPDMVKNLGFSAGGFDARFGDKMSSVLDITYKKPEQFESNVSFSMLGASAYVGIPGKKLTQMHGVRYKSASYLLGTLDVNGEYNPSFVDYQAAISYQFNPKWEMKFLGNFSQNSYNFIPQERKTSFGTLQQAQQLSIFFEGQESDLFRTEFGSLTLNFKPTNKLKLSLFTSLFNTDEKEEYDILGEYIINEINLDPSSEDKLGTVLGIGKYQEHARNRLSANVFQLGHSGQYVVYKNDFRWGVNIQQEIIKDKISEWEWRDSVGYSLPYVDDDYVNLYYNMKSNVSLESLRAAGFVQNTYKWQNERGRYSFTSGLRTSFWTYNKEWLVSPRFSFTHIPVWKKDISFRLATGVYAQAPFYKELRDTMTDGLGNVVAVLNPSIKAQRTLHFLVGGDYYFKSWDRPFKFTSEVYVKAGDRIISYSVENVKIRYSGENDSYALTGGVDFKLFGELLPGTDSWINLSLMSSKEKNTSLSQSKWIDRPNEQRYVFSLLFQDYLPKNPKYRLYLKGVWADGLPQGPPRNILLKSAFRSPSYKRFDIGASRVLAHQIDPFMDKTTFKHIKDIQIGFEVLNLFNFNNVNSYYWVTDIHNQQLAVPNYLTGIQYNFKIGINFQ